MNTISTSAPANAARGELAGKAAIVTGSTSGIGLGIAQALASAGINIMLNGFGDAAGINRIRKALEQTFGVKTLYSAADMSMPGDIEGMVDAARKTFGEVDILVNNAGIQHVEANETFPPAKWDAIIAINLSSAFHTIRVVVAEMKARKWGRIINIASAHALVASPFTSAYVASKHGIAGLTKTVALEVAEHGVTVNAICPSYVMTLWFKTKSLKLQRRVALPKNRSCRMCSCTPSRPGSSLQPNKSAASRSSFAAKLAPQLQARCSRSTGDRRRNEPRGFHAGLVAS